MSEFLDYYSVLGLDMDCSHDQIKKAFRKKLLEVHPDKSAFPRDPEEMRRLLEAHDILSDTDSRHRYDQMWNIVFREELLDKTPHVTDSERPRCQSEKYSFPVAGTKATGGCPAVGRSGTWCQIVSEKAPDR